MRDSLLSPVLDELKRHLSRESYLRKTNIVTMTATKPRALEVPTTSDWGTSRTLERAWLTPSVEGE